jgi:hypothetical protein
MFTYYTHILYKKRLKEGLQKKIGAIDAIIMTITGIMKVFSWELVDALQEVREVYKTASRWACPLSASRERILSTCGTKLLNRHGPHVQARETCECSWFSYGKFMQAADCRTRQCSTVTSIVALSP